MWIMLLGRCPTGIAPSPAESDMLSVSISSQSASPVPVTCFGGDPNGYTSDFYLFSRKMVGDL